MTTIEIMKLSPYGIIPTRATPHSAGLDLCSPRRVVVPKNGGSVALKLDIKIKIPNGFFGKIESKSKVAANKSIYAMAGVIDQDFDGNIHVQLVNLGTEDVLIGRWNAIAQLIIQPVIYPQPVETHFTIDEARRLSTILE